MSSSRGPLPFLREVGRFWSSESRAMKAGAIALLIAATADLGAGVVLSGSFSRIESLPGLLLLIPAAIALRGSTFGAFGARLGTALVVGTYEPELRPGSWLWRHVEAVGILTLVTSTEAALLARAMAALLGQPAMPLVDLIVISVVGGVAASVVLLFVTLFLARMSSLRGWSMDDVAAPAITATGDLLTVPAILLATHAAGRAGVTVIVASALGALTLGALVYGWMHHRQDVRRLVRESVVVLSGAALVSSLAGAVLQSRDGLFLAVPALLLLFPPFVAVFGSLGGILSSRLTSKLHLGIVEPRLRPDKPVVLELSTTFLFATVTYLYVGVATWALAHALGVTTPSLLTLIGVAMIGGLMGTCLLAVVATTAATATYRLGLDPDNHAIPVVTSVMDFLGMLCLVGAVALLQVGAT